LIKNCNLLIPRPPLRTPKLQEKPSALRKEHPVLKNMKILNFFLFLWVIFALLDPDPDPATQFNADPCGYGSGYGSGSETLPPLTPPSSYVKLISSLHSAFKRENLILLMFIDIHNEKPDIIACLFVT
jgi:hypothetical protein